MQTCTSRNTSINSKKLPAIVKAIDWDLYRGQSVLDYGGGKYDNLKDYLKAEYDITLHVYDKYNRSHEENIEAERCKPSLIICSNVLNVIDSNADIYDITKLLDSYRVTTVYSIYEGDKSGIGCYTKPDCYQRNAKAGEYIKFFIGDVFKLKTTQIKRNMIFIMY